MSNPDTESTTIQNNEFNSALTAELQGISMKAKDKPVEEPAKPEKVVSESISSSESETAITPESIEDGDNFLERTLDAAVDKVQDFIDDLGGDNKDTGDRVVFMLGKVGTLVFKILAAKLHSARALAGVSGDAMGYNLQVAKFAIEQGEYGVFLN